MAQRPAPPIRKIQTVAISVVGAIALVCFALSVVLAGPAADVFSTAGVIAALLAAVIGVSFAFTGGKP